MQNFEQQKHLVTGSFLRELRRRLFVIILVAVVPILGVILYQAKLASDVQLGEVLENAWELVENVALREARFIDSAKQLLTLLADVSDLTGSDTSSCRRFLKPLIDHNRGYVDLGVADANGAVHCHVNDAGNNGLNLIKTSHFRARPRGQKLCHRRLPAASTSGPQESQFRLSDHRWEWRRRLGHLRRARCWLDRPTRGRK